MTSVIADAIKHMGSNSESSAISQECWQIYLKIQSDNLKIVDFYQDNSQSWLVAKALNQYPVQNDSSINDFADTAKHQLSLRLPGFVPNFVQMEEVSD